MRTFLRSHARVQPHTRVLDIGCGPGDALNHLPPVKYTGVDISERYVAAAKRRYSHLGVFVVGSAANLTDLVDSKFDVVIAVGLLHHLDDDQLQQLFRAGRALLAPDGQMVTIDPVRVADHGRIARWIISKDRGRYVRTADSYIELAKRSFASVQIDIRHDLYRIPFSHAILTCSRNRVANPQRLLKGESDNNSSC